ncbi:acetyl-CoA carboxylase biotin carboxyl carrier protein [Rubinisphaera italica]|uniref:Biotin carboxyl carrier protein of acetyl-CoA carboxylase n=1 Tax=Rubinisphaera italica TaxID=2527969 RepID=A0A5C5X8P5_9PLAN|nr:acetyl-CoA carboxylase biotin carboxyl carrier protein [Rubinisphaera italica]TWT59376.1 Acetyl-CoA biotin carboxyl carrier [Rubinisphaera italica]
MNDKSKPKPDSTHGPIDLAQLKELMEMMEAHDVTEVNLRNGDEQWRLRRGPQVTAMPMQAMPTAMPPMAAPVAAPAQASSAPAASGDTAAPVDDGLIEIKSPTVGTFYSSPSPEDPAFVKVGSQVSAESIVCLVEAMKVFNQIPAECSGTVEKILAKDGDAVDFGQALFKVKPN